jgi:hypothetical protein
LGPFPNDKLQRVLANLLRGVTVDRQNLVGGLFWLGLSIFVCLISIKEDLGGVNSPGPGFFPFLSAVVLGFSAIILLVTSSLRKKKESFITDLWTGLKWSKVIWVLVSLFLYPFLLPILGYLITTVGLLTVLFSILGRSKAWVRGVNAVIITLISYVIFYFLLNVRLPKGFLGF